MSVLLKLWINNERFLKITSKSNTTNLRVFKRSRRYIKNMESTELCPPTIVQGMTLLDRELFTKTVLVPVLRVSDRKVNEITPLVKKIMLKMDRLKPIQTETPNESNTEVYKKILLHPSAIKDWTSLPFDMDRLDLKQESLRWENLELKYENWRADEILKSILPKDEEGVSSFSRIGHILHLNLKDHQTPFKHIIAEVLKEKTPGIKTIVNKSHVIDNTYRNFQFELLAGEENFYVAVRENNVTFEFDFSQVYWNPRLATEHEKIVKLLQPNSVLYDVCAGVGPFTVPAAKKKCIVLANDLNPHSFKYLNVNVTKNKVTNNVHTFNKDANDFIKTDMKTDLIKRLDQREVIDVHIVMNLPASAVEFIPSFHGLLSDYTSPVSIKPLLHVYCFAKGADGHDEIAKLLVEKYLEFKLSENILNEIAFVRNVAPNKNMMRVSFYLTEEILKFNRHKRKLQEDEVSQLSHKCN